jgi:hypothetical protein
MSDYIKAGVFRGDKIQYPDGIGCCVWVPFPATDEFPEPDEGMGICFDFSFEDIDDLIELLGKLKDAKANKVDE